MKKQNKVKRRAVLRHKRRGSKGKKHGQEPQRSAEKKVPAWEPDTSLTPYCREWLVMEALMLRFMPKNSLREFIADLIRVRHNQIGVDLPILIDRAFEGLRAHFEKHNPDGWKDKLAAIFGNAYPEMAREFWFGGSFAHHRYLGKQVNEDHLHTFVCDQVESLGKPKKLQLLRIAPALFEVEGTGADVKLLKTVEVERFTDGNESAIPKGALHEVVQYNRPVYGVNERWEYDEKKLPTLVKTADLLCKNVSLELLQGFLGELRSTFAWEDDETFVRYVGYLIQAMMAHLKPGQMPGYFFRGPTKAGKGYLAHALPAMLYSRPGASCVSVHMLPRDNYELNVLMQDARHALFVTFDEVQHASQEQLKPIDNLLTNSVVQVRKFGKGYISQPNHYVIALTAVHRKLTDETDGRLATITLTESRPEKIEAFHRRWASRGPELLAALFQKVSQVKFEMDAVPIVPGRRPGFGIVAYFLKQGFGLAAEYKIEATDNDVLELICQFFAETKSKKVGQWKRPWKRYSARNIGQFLSDRGEGLPRRELETLLTTTLGYGSTEQHPSMKDTGYEAEDGSCYHIKWISEGQKKKRYVLSVRAVTGKEAGNAAT